MSWPVVTLGHALRDAEVFVDGDWVESKDQDPQGDVRLVQLADVGDGKYLDKSARFLTSAKARELRCTYLRAGDVIIARMPDPIGRACIFPGDAKPSVTVVDVCIARPSEKGPDARWMMHCLNSPAIRSRIAGFATGTTRSRISRSNLARVKIPLPPLPEQRRIAEILDKADELRAKRRAALAKLDSLTQSIFLDMFGDPDGHQWPIVKVADLADYTQAGIRTGPFGSQLLHSEFTDSGIAVLGIDNVVENDFRWAQRRHISGEKYRQLARYTVRPGDVLITIMGTIGRCAIVPNNIPTAINTKHLCCISLDRSKCLPSFLHAYFLRHPIAQRHLAQKAKGAIMEGLNMGIIKEMPIPLVPLDLQNAFDARLVHLRDIQQIGRESAGRLDGLFGSIQDRAFGGDL